MSSSEKSIKKPSIPVTVHIVIEGKFLIFTYVPICEDAHADMLSHCPFRDVTVRVATMICESADATSLCGIDILETQRRTVSGLWRNQKI